jgi:putative tryptophan/tyrosine transport system substrate-binding protein
MRRRQFIAGLGGAVAAWPVAGRAQRSDRVRRVAALIYGLETSPDLNSSVSAFKGELQKLGWIEGRNLRIDVRFAGSDANRIRAYAQELVAAAPDVIVANSAPVTKAVQQRTKTIPIVFVAVGDPVNGQIVQSIARPEGNTTGITNLFASVAGRWVELLKDAAPNVTRVAIVFNPEFHFDDYNASIEEAAATLGLKAIRAPVRDAAEIERAIDAFAAEANGGLIMRPPPFIGADNEMIVRLALRHRLPTIGVTESDVAASSMVSYGPDFPDMYRVAASYVDRMLRGAKVGELPVQFPTRFRLIVNLKTAKAIGLTIPETFLLRADEVIE